MELNVKEVGEIVVLTLSGKLMGSPEELSLIDTIRESADKNRCKVVLDLSRLDWMNSLGLGMCVSGLTTLRNRGGDLRLVKPPEQLVSLMKKCHLYSLFKTYAAADEAIADF